MIRILAALLVLVAAAPLHLRASAQQTTPTVTEDMLRQLGEAAKSPPASPRAAATVATVVSAGAPAFCDAKVRETLSEKARDAADAACLAHFEHARSMFGVNAFGWWLHQANTALLTLFVVVLSLSGVWLAAVQLRGVIRMGDPSQLRTQIEAGLDAGALKSLRFESSVVGISLLFLSFFFFYLYVIEVYRFTQ